MSPSTFLLLVHIYNQVEHVQNSQISGFKCPIVSVVFSPFLHWPTALLSKLFHLLMLRISAAYSKHKAHLLL